MLDAKQLYLSYIRFTDHLRNKVIKKEDIGTEKEQNYVHTRDLFMAYIINNHETEFNFILPGNNYIAIENSEKMSLIDIFAFQIDNKNRSIGFMYNDIDKFFNDLNM